MDTIHLGVKRTNVAAQAFLLRDAELDTVQIEGDEAGDGGGQRVRQRAQQSDTLLQKFEVALGVSGHVLGPFIELVFFFTLWFHQQRSWNIRPRDLGLFRLLRALLIAIFFFSW